MWKIRQGSRDSWAHGFIVRKQREKEKCWCPAHFLLLVHSVILAPGTELLTARVGLP